MKPTALIVDPERIPDALKAEPRWVCWRYVYDKNRWQKIPCTISGRYARHNEPSSWTSFDEVLGAYRSDYFDGIGFALGDGHAGIDLDRCLHEGVIVEHARAAAARLEAAYVEHSPSGTGLKVFGRSDRIGGEIKFDTNAFVPFERARFFAVTGHGQGNPDTDLTAIINEWFPPRPVRRDFGPVPSFLRVGDTRGTENIPTLTDEEVISRILATPQAEKFMRLARGDISEYGNDHSRADQALVSILMYWCQGDIDQVDRLFRQSALMRPKWNTPSYRRATLAKAVPR